MNIPDFISPIVAWRVWQWDAAGLRSLNGEQWLPGKPLRAGCNTSSGRAHATDLSHDAPQFDCTCGIYGSKSLDHLRRTQYWQYGGVHGEVNLWGSVVEHEHGYRAEFAHPKTLYLSSETLPITLKEIQTRLQTLIGYSCDLFISNDRSRIPLLLRWSGLHAAGLDFLMSRAEEWYTRHKHDRTLKPGERIAVLGHGIALVKRVDENDVCAVLWNRKNVRLNRRHVSWDKSNLRWEVSAAGVEAPAVPRFLYRGEPTSRGFRADSTLSVYSNPMTLNRRTP